MTAGEEKSVTLKAALDYQIRGWAVIRVPFKEKAPKEKGWQKQRLTAEEINQKFAKGKSNVGVLLGEPSGGLIDIDLDCDETVALAGKMLPDTGFVFGRPSKTGSHRLYNVDTILKTKQFEDVSGDMLV